jgi:hypothetical protein
MGLSALSFDEGQFYSINTSNSGKFYPIVKNEDQYVYKRKIPIVIDTESSPYLYLSGNSGIEILPEIDENLRKGVSVPINETLKPAQEVVGMQMFLMYNESNSFTERKRIGKIFSSDDSYDIVLIPEEDGKRAFFKIFDTYTGTEFINSRFFLNGKIVNSVVIEPLTWNYIAISFEKEDNEAHYPIFLDQIIGEIEIYSGVKVDNIASFIELGAEKQELTSYDKWYDTDDDYWQVLSASSTWIEVLNPQTLFITLLSLDGEDIFNTYLGLSSVIGNDNSILDVNQDSLVVLNDISWDSYLI